MSEDSNLTDKGADILLPPQGNPFKSAPEGKAVGASDGAGDSDEPADLSPADVAAMFPSTQDERNNVPPPADPPVLTADDDPPPPALTPEQIAEMVADQPEHQSARAPMIIHSSEPGRAPQPNAINLSAFNPDALVGSSSPTHRSKATLGDKVDIAAFNPDAVIEDATPTDSSVLNTDAPLPDSPALPDPDFTLPASDAPLPPVVLQPLPTEDSAPATPGPSTSSVTVSASSAPTSGNPANPPSTASVTVTTTPASDSAPAFDSFPPRPIPTDTAILPETSAEAPVISAPSTTANQAAVTFTTGGSTVTAAVSTPPAEDDFSSGYSDSTLPTAPPIALPVQADLKIVNRLVSNDVVQALWQRIDKAEKAVISDENLLPKQRTDNLENLKAARNLLFGARENYEDASRYVAQAESDLLYAARVRKWSYSYGSWVLLYNVLWIGLLTAGYAFANRIIGGFVQGGVIDQTNAFSVWITVLSGGLGGVSKSLFTLHQHVTKQDFDRQHLMWYYTSPIIGVVLGIFVYMFVQRVIIGAGAIAGLDGTQAVNNAGFVFYLLAWVVGFQQNLVLELVERVKSILLSADEQKDAKP
jgi:hypothetical protein